MAIKPITFLYEARLNALGVPTSGLTNVKAQIYLDGVAKAVAANALTLTEVDATNAPGMYSLTVSTAQLVAFGATVGQNFEAYINSATANAPAEYREKITQISTDDLDAHLSTQDTAIASVKSDTSAIKADLETGAASLANILAGINQIKANAGFAISIPATLLKPASGSNTYRIPITIYDDANNLLDADAVPTVTLVNQAGADRSSYLVGYVAGTPGSAPAVRDSKGQYHVDVVIPSTAAQEELLFKISYAIGGLSTARISTSEIISDVQADGFALQSTLLATQTTVNANNALLTDANTGLSAIKSQTAAIQTQTDKLGDGTIGLAAIKTQVNAVLTEITGNVETALANLNTLVQNVGKGGRAI